MVNRASLFLALRYLRPKRSFVSVITTISILGVAVGVLMMVVVRAVMLGFEVDFRDTLMGAEPHVLLSRDTTSSEAPPWQEALKKIKPATGILSAAPYAGGMMYMANGDYQTATLVLGLSPAEATRNLAKLQPHLLDGSLDLADGTIVICDEHAQQLGVRLGDEISVYASQNVNAAVRQYSAANEEDSSEKKQAILDQIKLHPQTLRISGVLRTESAGYNGYVSLKTGQALYQLGDQVTGIALELTSPLQAKILAQGLTNQLPGWKYSLWTDAGEARLAAMQNEQTMMQFVLSIIALVAAFSVMNTTITVTTQKRREIGVLAALGSKPGQIVNVFLVQAVVVGVLGTGIGLIGSLLVLWLRNDIREIITWVTGGQVHAVEGVFLSTIPAYVQPWDVTLTCLISIALCIVAGLIPAWFAARVDPAVALRD
ncbi:lipoprotein-releasing system permease protein [Prosthecobacter debontii]|uniref:Lipoprotein-releasing system permease protein n=1 Tax=Prosthecobacter debontii TaxID=48467 RepID=A0A1T4Y4X8_9BACT|nr:ABC transporter permease [Prosthecobacter debontii]SKA96345.1 lipoprotein-releasing system permease protein [Prosthecobacter debontii]